MLSNTSLGEENNAASAQDRDPIVVGGDEVAAAAVASPADSEEEQRRSADASAPSEAVHLPNNKLPIRFIERHLKDYCYDLELLRELVAYIPFLILFIFYELYGLNMEERFWLNSQVGGNLLTGVTSSKEAIWTLRSGEVEGYHVPLMFENIRNADEWHAWVQSILIPELWDAGLNPSENQTQDLSSRWIVGGNKPLGSVRFRVLRVKGESCAMNIAALNGGEFVNVPFMQAQPGIGSGGCYPEYEDSKTNRSTLLLDTSTVSRRSAVNTMPFVECAIAGNSDWGLHAVYSCGGNVFDVPFSLSMDDALTEVQRLRNGFQSWQGFGALEESLVDTRLMVVEYFTYTPALNVFSSFKSFTEITVGGRLETYVRSQNFFLWSSHLVGYTVFFAFFMLAVVFYTMALVRKVVRAARVGALWSQCLLSGWFFLDVANVLIFYMSFIVHIIWIAQSSSTGVQVWYPTLEERDGYPQQLEFVLLLYQLEQYFNATNTVLCFLKLIKFTALHSDMGIVIGTLQRAKDTMLSVLIIFLLVVLAYAVAGTVLFGTFIPDDFSTVSKSFSSLLRLLVGDFNYDAMRVVNAAVAGLFFWSFVILGLFLMLSFIVGLLASEFGEERERVDEDMKKTAIRSVVAADGAGAQNPQTKKEAPPLKERVRALFTAFRRDPKLAIHNASSKVLLWLRAPRYMRRLQRAVMEHSAAELVKLNAEVAGMDVKTASKKRKHLRRRRCTAEKLMDIVVQHRGRAIPASLVLDFWSEASDAIAFDKELRQEDAEDVALQNLKDAVDHVLSDLFGLVAAGERSMGHAELEQYRASQNLWSNIRDTAASFSGVDATENVDRGGTAGKQEYSLSSISAAREALQVRDALLHEHEMHAQLQALDTMVARLERCALEAVAAATVGSGAERTPF